MGPVDGQRHEVARHQGHEAGITQEPREFLAQVELNVLGVEAFERPIPGLLKENEDREDLRGMQPGRASSLACATAQ
jgi:hypothetical protein